MFTGIVEEVGVLESERRGQKSSVLTIRARKVLEGTKIGDSIAVNGVCLTVVRLSDQTFDADVMAETMRRSSLSGLKRGGNVNLERALTLNARLGGHIVSGHIDGTGTIRSYREEDNAVWITIEAGASILKYVVEKGSIAIDGVSLTVASVDGAGFQVSIIPHTGEETILLRKKPGALVNLECDLIGKYVEKLLFAGTEAQQKKETAGVDQAMLERYGFF